MSEDAHDRYRWPGSVPKAWLVFAAAAIVIIAFIVFGALELWPGLLGLAVIVAAAVTGGSRKPQRLTRDMSSPVTPIADGDLMLAAVIRGIPDPVVAVNPGGRVLAFNAHMLALAPALRVGEPVSIALRMPELVEAIRGAIASGEVRRVELSVRVPAERWYEAFATPVRREAGPAGPISLLLVSLRDLTPLREVEQLRADFVANASHELRTPLAALSGFIETLQGPARDDPDARARFLPIMQAQASRMARLIDDLLSLSRIERNEHRQPQTMVEIAPLARQVVDGLETLARERDVAIAVTEPPLRLRVLGDRDELIRAIENLVENALKYGAAGKRVDIDITSATASDGSPELRLSVRDYGPGITSEHLPRLTERFYRVDVADSRAQGGTGLGLALVKHILNRHRGRLSIASAPGAGATFTMHIPLLSETAGDATISADIP